MNKETKITIIDLLQIIENKDIKRALKYHYPSVKGDPLETIEGFRKMKKSPVPKGKYLNIYTCGAPSDFLEKHNIPYTLKEMNEDNYYSMDIKKDGDDCAWSMSFMPWKEAANLPINTDTLNHYTYADIIAHFIWEITWYGNEAETKKKSKGLMDTIKEIKAGKGKFVPLKEVIKKLKDEK